MYVTSHLINYYFYSVVNVQLIKHKAMHTHKYIESSLSCKLKKKVKRKPWLCGLQLQKEVILNQNSQAVKKRV